ncbi:MAG: DUF4197 domain-containing protein [Sphingomonadaceae bacterium]|nr:DUF4197 domain-containing protein [Sphingomonadaceae bacterium]MCP5383485.1 DUF4197 domain-containing protein [Altererythrobacter sp.]MCP5391490.1 DUF4197 domain-containing protein [Sphingomonadaceae bacterium]MCP5394427.1 DUF4197 domain-containing protein [Sphingomonadaceae bacterium]
MSDIVRAGVDRRGFIVGATALGTVSLSGCAGLPGYSFTDAIRRLLLLSSERAFARLTAPGGYWDDQVARIGLGSIMGTRGDILSSILTSALFKSQLEGAFADLAIKGAERAAPVVADAVRVVGISAAEQLIRGGPTAATSFLRGEMGNTLIDTMVPELGQAIRVAQNPVIGNAIARLSGVDVAGVATRLSDDINDAIWTEMGVEESEIRRNPRATNDPLLIGVFGVAAGI